MTALKKLLVSFMVTVLVSTCFGVNAYASELTSGEPGETVTTTATLTSNLDNMNGNTVTRATAEGLSTESLSEEALMGQDQAVAHEEGADVEGTLTEDVLGIEEAEVDFDAEAADDTEATDEVEAIEDTEEETDETEETEAEEATDAADVTEATKAGDKGSEKETSKNSQEEATVSKKPSYSEKDLRLLAALVYAEAGNQSYSGMLAVANVVLNRVKSDIYWHANTIEEVIYDRKWSVQFAVTVKSKKTGMSMLDKALKAYDTGEFTGGNPAAEKEAMDRAIKVAKHALNGKNNIGDFLCFQNKRSASRIKRNYPGDYKILGDHIFYRTK